MSIQIKKSLEDIATYREVGPKFGAILSNIAVQIREAEIRSPRVVTNTFLDNTRRLALDIDYPFGYEQNEYGESFENILCISVNNCVAHGRSTTNFAIGDIVTIDAGISIPAALENRRLHFDAAITVEVKANNCIHLVKAPLVALERIRDMDPPIDDLKISSIIENIARDLNLNIVSCLSGHGIGYKLHEPPMIPNILSPLGGSTKLIPNTIICPEPMYVIDGAGEQATVYLDPDGWSVMTEKLSSHWETMFLYDGEKFEDIVGITREWSV